MLLRYLSKDDYISCVIVNTSITTNINTTNIATNKITHIPT